jgi:hypothetical protein
MDLQFATEVTAVPNRYFFGGNVSDLQGLDGKQRSLFEAYIDAMLIHPNTDAKIGQLAQADLANYQATITVLAEMASSVTGLPLRYFGQNTANPASEGSIRADESRLVRNVELKNRDRGDAWGWVVALYHRFRTGEWLNGNHIRAEWVDPNTPTQSERADAAQKLAGGVALLSREGVWDSWGWSEERKARERAYLAEEEADPVLGLLASKTPPTTTLGQDTGNAPEPGATG